MFHLQKKVKKILGTSATIRLIEGVRLIRCLLHTGCTVFFIPKLGLACSRPLFTSGMSDAIMLQLFKETPKDVTYTLMGLENIY